MQQTAETLLLLTWKDPSETVNTKKMGLCNIAGLRQRS